jgi:REP element-mobilizing transposase RayT
VGHRGRQLGFVFRTRGGARRGAGRPPNGAHAGVSHLRRPAVSPQHPVHVTLAVRRDLPSLREPSLFPSVLRALARAKERFGFALVHFSVQRDHVHLIAEARDRTALARGLQGLAVRVARAVNRRLQRSGKLFRDRYHARALKTPRTARLALRYVLLNARKHTRAVPCGFVDPCSSAPWFPGFARPDTLTFGARAARAECRRHCDSTAPPVVAPRSWLLRVGLQRAGPIDVDDTPGQ